MRERMDDMGLLALRVCVGCLMLTHGIPKLIDFKERAPMFPDPIGIGSELGAQLVVGAEVGCALLLIVGLFTRLATLPLLFMMLVAVVVQHRTDGWEQQELPLLYAVVFLTLLLTGPGARSIDGWFERRVLGAKRTPNQLDMLDEDDEFLAFED